MMRVEVAGVSKSGMVDALAEQVWLVTVAMPKRMATDLHPGAWIDITLPEGCAHGCGYQAGNDGYCERCYADRCLVPPDGQCRYTTDEGDDDGTTG